MVIEKKLSLKPLTEEEYANVFATFIAGSTEYLEIPRLVLPIINSFNGKRIDLMSIGAGTGCLEDDLIKNYGLNLQNFLAIEPNTDHYEKLTAIVDSWNNVDLTIEQRLFDEEYKTEKRFDMILMSHSMYCMENPVKVMIKAKSFLKPNGKLVIFSQTHTGGYELYAEMRKTVSLESRPINDHFVTSKYIAMALENNGIKHDLKEGPSALDVSEFINKSKSSTANDVVTFLLQTDYENLNDDLKHRIYQMVKERVSTDRNGRHMFNHPSGMVVCYGD